MPWLIGPSVPDVALLPDSSRSRRRKTLAAGCCVRVLVLSGVARLAPAQTAHFAGAQTVLLATGDGLSAPSAIVMDASGNVWVTNSNGNIVSAFASAGAALPGSPSNTRGLDAPVRVAATPQIAVLATRTRPL